MIDSGYLAQIHDRSNYFEDCLRNWVYVNSEQGYIKSDGNSIFIGVDTVNAARPSGVLWEVASQYTDVPLLSNTADVKAFVLANSGNVLHLL